MRSGGVPGVELEMTELVMGETRAHGSGSTATSSSAAFPCSARVDCDLSCRMREPRGCCGSSRRRRHAAAPVQLPLRPRAARAPRAARPARRVHPGLRATRRATVLLGDFNEWHRGPVTRGLRREFSSPMRRRRTHPAMVPAVRAGSNLLGRRARGRAVQRAGAAWPASPPTICPWSRGYACATDRRVWRRT